MNLGNHFYYGINWACRSVDRRLKSLERNHMKIRREAFREALQIVRNYPDDLDKIIALLQKKIPTRG